MSILEKPTGRKGAVFLNQLLDKIGIWLRSYHHCGKRRVRAQIQKNISDLIKEESVCI